MSRIAQTFERLKEQGRSALIPFIMACDPDYQTSEELLHQLPGAGADIIELGMPFSDPMADGPIIQEAGSRALKAGATVKKILAMVESFRKKDTQTPIVLMGYYNPILHYDQEQFAKDAKAAGVDGLLIVDVPIEEDDQLHASCTKHGIDLIKLVTPTTDKARLQKIEQKAMGFLYYVAVAGVTGTKTAADADIAAAVNFIKEEVTLPVAVGFGINSPEAAAKTGACADAVVVGSALIKTLSNAKPEHQVKDALAFVQSLSKALEN
jgi:tryptophan synthase alpha chain